MKNVYACDAFGNTLAGVEEVYSYNAKSGYYYDSETGFYYCLQRYYDPANGRWLTEDPIGYEGGLNLYGYCGNSPVGSVDASGKNPIIAVVAVYLLNHVLEIGVIGSVLTMGYINYERSGNDFHVALDTMSSAPMIGEGCDALNAGLYLYEGKKEEASFSFGAAFIPGVTGAMLKYGGKGVKSEVNAGYNTLLSQIVSINGHHSWPKFLGGNPNQLLKWLPEKLHIKYHIGLVKHYKNIGISFPKGVKWYDHLRSLSDEEQRKALEGFLNYTKDFDDEHGTDLMKYIFDEADNL